MKRLVLTLLILVSATLPLGAQQKRTYITKDYSFFQQDLFVLHQEDGCLLYYARLHNLSHYDDSVFVVMTRDECRQMHTALKEVKKCYQRWRVAARLRRITDYSRPIEIQMPNVFFVWQCFDDDNLGLPRMVPRIHRSAKAPFPQFVFDVDKEGWPRLLVSAMITDAKDSSITYPLEVLFPGASRLQNFIDRCDINKTDAALEKLEPTPRSSEYYDRIFK